MRRAPAFWWRASPSLAARLLAPAGWIYGAMTARRMARPGRRLAVPVICVGNFVAGGAGKTPAAIALARLLTDLGHRPAFLSRGYGRERTTDAVVAVGSDRHTAAEVGDEPLLLARAAPTFVARDRMAAGRAAVAAGATVLVLDDGLQNPALHKDVVLAAVDARLGVGNGLCLPAGPLRAPLAAQWPHVSALCVIGTGDRGGAMTREARGRGTAVWTARLEADRRAVAGLAGRPLYAFAGIGQPEKFFDTVRACGLGLVGRRAFPDHHRFTPADIAALGEAAGRLGATLVTTEKDRVRLPEKLAVATLPVRLVFDDEPAVGDWLARRLSLAARP